jgi:hypothetical protein
MTAKTKHRHLRALLQLQRVAVLAWHGQSCPLSPSCVVIKNSTGNLVSSDISHLPIFTLKPPFRFQSAFDFAER